MNRLEKICFFSSSGAIALGFITGAITSYVTKNPLYIIAGGVTGSVIASPFIVTGGASYNERTKRRQEEKPNTEYKN